MVRIVIWMTGHVEWRTNKGLEKYYEYYEDEFYEGCGIVPQKLHDMVNAWVQEHNMILNGSAFEADFMAGTVTFVDDDKNIH